MLNKKFSERLNTELSNIGVPETTLERIAVLAKILKIPKFKAEVLLSGSIIPDQILAATLAQELEVNVDWLLGKTDSKSNTH
jgi:hypothetical protein